MTSLSHFPSNSFPNSSSTPSDANEMHTALASGDIFTLARLHRTDGLAPLEGVSIDMPAARGYLEVLQLLCESASATYTSNALDNAAAAGHLDVVQYLHGTMHAKYTTDAMDGAAMNGHWDVVQYLLETRDDEWELLSTSLEVPLAPLATLCTVRVMEAAAKHGRLDLVQQFHRAGLPSSTGAMDKAAKRGHFDVVQFLHAHRTEGCTTRAMDKAAACGHFDVVQFLHTHRTEGCTTRAMDKAAACGHFDVVQFLHTHRTEGCTTDAMDDAAANGHIEVVQYLWANRTEGFTCRAVEMAAKPGCVKAERGALDQHECALRIGDHRHVKILRMLFYARPDLFDLTVLSSLLLCGAFDLWLELQQFASRHEGEETAMILAGERGHLSTIRFLRDVQSCRDLLPLALASATLERPTWLTALYRDDPASVYSYQLDYHYNDHATTSLPFEPWRSHSFFLKDGIPDWMIAQALVDHDRKQQHREAHPWTWANWAIYRNDRAALAVIWRLEASDDYMSDPRFSFDGARSHAVRVGRLGLLQWLFANLPHVAIEPTLLDDAICYGQLEIATWLAHHQPDACAEFPGAKAWALAPLNVRLTTQFVDALESDTQLSALVDFGGVAAYAAEQGNLVLLERLVAKYPASVMARRDLVDRTVLANSGACDLSVLQYLKGIGYTHASAVAMDSVTRDSQLTLLRFLYEHYRHDEITLRGLMDAAKHDSWNIVRFHLKHGGLTDAVREAVRAKTIDSVREVWVARFSQLMLAQEANKDHLLQTEWLSDSEI